MVKQAIIYGNGPSRVLYNTFKERRSDCLIACNLVEPGIDPDYIAIIDSQPIGFMHEHKIYPTAPLWISGRSHNMIKHHEMLDKIKIDTIWPDVHRYNCGIYVVKECLNRQWDVHLFGFDSMFSDSLESPAMDRIIPRHRRPKHLDKQWQDHWRKVLSDRTNTINIHMFQDSQPKEHLKGNDQIKIHRHQELSTNFDEA